MTPPDIFAPFAGAALDVLPWIVAGLSAAMVLFIAVLGIRKGLAFFFTMVATARDTAYLRREMRAAESDDYDTDRTGLAASDFDTSPGGNSGW